MRSFLLFLLAATFSLSAAAKPSPESAREVIDFYFNGQEQGIVLVDVKLCADVYSEGESKNECKDELQPNALEKGQSFMLWMAFMVPADMDPQKVTMHFNHKGEDLDVKTASAASSLRYRTWRKVTLDRSGDWTLKISHDNGSDIELLKELNIKVQPAAVEVAAQPEPAEVEAQPEPAGAEA
uniref:hypothetical protein n=1 Tax=Thiohalomonas denitrificans TaxID=415747 RepID=UPI0026EA56CB